MHVKMKTVDIRECGAAQPKEVTLWLSTDISMIGGQGCSTQSNEDLEWICSIRVERLQRMKRIENS